MGLSHPALKSAECHWTSGWLGVSWSTLSARVSPGLITGWSCSRISAPAIVLAQECRHMFLEPRQASALVHHQVSGVLRLVLQCVHCHVWVVRHPRSYQQGGATGEPIGFGLACPHLHYYPLGPELRLPRCFGALVVRGHQPQWRRRVGPGAQELRPCHIHVRLLVLAFDEYVAEDVHEGCRQGVRRPPRGGDRPPWQQ